MGDLERIAILEGRVQELENKIQGIPRSSGSSASSTGATVRGALPSNLMSIFNNGFEWIANKVNVKPKSAGGISVDSSGVGVKLETNQGLSLSASGLAVKRKSGGGIAVDSNGLYISLTEFIDQVSAQFDKTDASLANITGLSIAVVAGTSYRFRAVLFVDADAIGGHKYAISGTCTATAIIYQIQGTDAIDSRETALGGDAGAVGSTVVHTEINGVITVGVSGNLTVQFAQNVANGTSSVLVGSHFIVSEVTP